MTAEASSSTRNPPQLSVVLVTDGFESIRPVLERLHLQTARNALEVVLVTPSRETFLAAAEGLDGFAAVQVVELSLLGSLGEPRAVGVRAASAPLVFIGETHSLAHPEMAQTLIDAHARPWAIVVPGFGNANPQGPVSWAGFIADYGGWIAGLPARQIDYAPIYNASFRRSCLLEFGDRLGLALSYGDELIVGLHRRGHLMYFEPVARIDHVNLARPAAFFRERYLAGRLIAAQRRQRWSPGRRLVYVCGAPLLPAVYLYRVRAGMRVLRRDTKLPPGTLPMTVAGAVVKAAGEMIGYALGAPAGAQERMADYELHKLRHVAFPQG